MEQTAANYKYPPPLATYEDVIKNQELFMGTLEELHRTMGSKFMIPIIGGKELDLHRLFIEVTSRGGLKRIIMEKRWKDVTSVFSFPSKATNASFILRKYYISLLYHYEQIYFFKSEEWTPLPCASLSVASSSSYPTQGPTQFVGSSFEAQPAAQKQVKGIEEIPREGCPVMGVIDGKFEHGYLVTVTIGSEKLKGVLYHVPEHSSGSHLSPFHSGAHTNTGSAIPTSGTHRRRRRKKSEMRKRDPSHPKPKRSGYNFFFAEQHARLKPLHPGKEREISRMIGELWNNLTETEKAVYQDRGVKDKERYRTEMEEYKERLKTIPIHAIPIQQRAPVPTTSNVDPDTKSEVESGLHETLVGGSSSEESETDEEKSAGKSLEMDASLEAETGTDSGNHGEDPSVEGDGFEVRKRNEDAKTNEVEGPSSQFRSGDAK